MPTEAWFAVEDWKLRQQEEHQALVDWEAARRRYRAGHPERERAREHYESCCYRTSMVRAAARQTLAIGDFDVDDMV